MDHSPLTDILESHSMGFGVSTVTSKIFEEGERQ